MVMKKKKYTNPASVVVPLPYVTVLQSGTGTPNPNVGGGDTTEANSRQFDGMDEDF